MGFITARVAPLAEADPQDRRLMHLDSPALDTEHVVYLLTIGTVPHLRNKVALMEHSRMNSARSSRGLRTRMELQACGLAFGCAQWVLCTMVVYPKHRRVCTHPNACSIRFPHDADTMCRALRVTYCGWSSAVHGS